MGQNKDKCESGIYNIEELKNIKFKFYVISRRRYGFDISLYSMWKREKYLIEMELKNYISSYAKNINQINNIRIQCIKYKLNLNSYEEEEK